MKCTMMEYFHNNKDSNKSKKEVSKSNIKSNISIKDNKLRKLTKLIDNKSKNKILGVKRKENKNIKKKENKINKIENKNNKNENKKKKK